MPVAGNVHMIQRPDGFANVGVFVGEEGVLLVDSQFEPHAEDLVAAVGKLTDGEIRFLINTLSLVKTRAASKSRTYALLAPHEFRGEEGQTPPPCCAYSSFSSLSAPVRCGRCVGAEPTS